MLPIGLRERKKMQTRAAIEHATVDLIESLGLERLTVEAIATRADVTSRTFFNHFASKEDALLGVPRDRDVRVAPPPRPVDGPPLRIAMAYVRSQLESINPESVDLDRRRRELLHRYPTLLGRAFERILLFEEGLADYLRSAGVADPEQARAVTMVIVAGSRLAVELWSGEESGAGELTKAFDQAMAAIIDVTAEARPEPAA